MVKFHIWWVIAFAILASAGYAYDLYARWRADKPGNLRRFPLTGLSGFITALLMLGAGVAWAMYDAISGLLAMLLMVGVPFALATLAETLFKRRISA